MIEEHVGKRRRQEVRQAISMQEELRKTILLVSIVLVVSVLLICLLMYLSAAGHIESDGMLGLLAPVIVLIIALLIICPNVNKFLSLRESYKAHVRRYNISKEDMSMFKERDRSGLRNGND